ncbi:ATP-binding cassette domain-containing protein [uncultured Leifsonia sp.]|uniref:ATP-binding cassette domain-containing protein n=1 Tax=uncultured Leifsonia sp. TaxID=340359 RepID=UPI0025CD763F|nr:ATP-binding cassette domain-containing protein [uncultured Leifsonia sp.]
MSTGSGARMELHAVAHAFSPGSPIFQGLTETLTAGDVWAVTGPSGSGKSTLLSLLAGWESPTAGHIRRVGVDTVGWVFQNPHGQARRTVLDHVVYPIIARGNPRQEAAWRAERILDELGLRALAKRTFAQLSGGEAQRLMLCRAIAAEPDLLLVDEPTAQLDRTNAATVNGVLQSLAGIGAIVVVATHDQDTVVACSRRLALDASPALARGPRS